MSGPVFKYDHLATLYSHNTASDSSVATGVGLPDEIQLEPDLALKT